MISLSNVAGLVVAGSNCRLFGCKLDGVDMGDCSYIAVVTGGRAIDGARLMK